MYDKTLLNGLLFLEILGKSDNARGVSELARETGISKTSTHRLLRTLVSAGYVAQKTPAAGYTLTTKMWELGSKALARLDVKQIGAPYLRALVNETSESAHISILDRAEVIYIDKIDSPQPVRTFSPIGGRAPAYCVATGKAMLAYQSDEAITAICANLKGYTKKTITSEAKLRQQLERVREVGYATNQGEWREKVASIGAPVFDAQGQVVAALGISGPVDRLGPTVMRKLSDLVIGAARDISRELGHSPR